MTKKKQIGLNGPASEVFRRTFSPRDFYESGGMESAGIENRSEMRNYAFQPVRYAYDVLKVKMLTPRQEEILNAIHERPYFVLARSANNQGKDFVAGVLTNYWSDVFDPSIVLLSGPSAEHTLQVLWAEIKKIRMKAINLGADLTMDGFVPVNAHWQRGPDHYVTALNVEKIESYQGRHVPRILFILDEATSADLALFDAIDTMFDASMGHAKLFISNPLSISSALYQEEQKAVRPDGSLRSKVIWMPATEHPNIKAELQGQPKPIPNAISLEQFRLWLDSCDEVPMEDFKGPDTHIIWPPKEYSTEQNPSRCYCHEHSPSFQCRALGIWPAEGASVWGKLALELTCKDLPTHRCVCGKCGKEENIYTGLRRGCCGMPMHFYKWTPEFPIHELPVLGVDNATGCGGDWFAATARWGDYAILHETSNTMDPLAIENKLRQMVRFCVELFNKKLPEGSQPITHSNIKVQIDDDMVGRGVCSHLWPEGYWLVPINNAAKTPTASPGFVSTALPTNPLYPNIRSQLWFEVAERGKHGHVLLGGLPKDVRDKFRMQVASVQWKLNNRGQNEVESKQITKDRIGRSPDTADSILLCYFVPTGLSAPKLDNLPINKERDMTNEERHDAARERAAERTISLYRRMMGGESRARNRWGGFFR
jgi:hypothetical protein